MSKRDDVIAGLNYEKYIEDFFIELGEEMATCNPNRKVTKKVGDVYNIDNMIIECKFQKKCDMKDFIRSAIREADRHKADLKKIRKEKLQEDQDEKDSEELLKNIKNRTPVTQDQENKDENIEEVEETDEDHIMPVIFFKYRENKEIDPDPNTNDLVIMLKEDWAELFKEYKKKHNKIHFGEFKPLEIKKD